MALLEALPTRRSLLRTSSQYQRGELSGKPKSGCGRMPSFTHLSQVSGEMQSSPAPVAEFRHSVAWAQIVLAYSHAARPPAELQGNPLAVIKPTGANATASRSVASGLTSSPSWYGVTHYADHRHQRASVVLSRRFGLSEVNQRCEVKAALGDGVEFLGDSL
jgi:hypothetical protein